jgi:branched-chain amino acid aminotransferase
MKIYIDGEFFGRDDAKISVFDHGLLYGDGIFEGIRIYNGKAFLLDEHIDRLFRSARAIMLEIGMSKKDLCEAIGETMSLNGRVGSGVTGYIRLVVTRGKGKLGIDPASCLRSSVIIITEDLQLYPEKTYNEGMSLITATVRRNRVDSLDTRSKSLNYLNNIMAKMEAQNSGSPEAVVLNERGFVAECTADNIFIVTAGSVVTPPEQDGALAGITRECVSKTICAALGIEVKERSMTLYDIYTADECFLTGSGAEIVPVVSVDRRVIGDGVPGPVTDSIRKEFSRYTDSF